MKRFLCWVLAFMLVFSMTACNTQGPAGEEGNKGTDVSPNQDANGADAKTGQSGQPDAAKDTNAGGYDYEAAESMKVGILQPLTGSMSYYGDRIKWALGHEAEKINEAGGVLGKPIELAYYDIGTNDESMTVSACEKAIRDSETQGFSAFYGPINGAPCLACAPLVTEAQIPTLYISTSQNIRDGGYEYMWNHRIPADIANSVLAGCAKELWGVNNVAVLYYTLAGAIVEKDAFVAGCEEYGIDVKAEIAYQIDDVDFTAQATQVAKLKDEIDGVFLVCDNGETPALVIAALHAYGFDKVIMTNNAGMNDTTISTAEALSPGATANMKSTTEVNLQDPEVAAWAEELIAIDSSFDLPGWYEACAVDALRLMCQAAELQNSIDPVQINQGLAKIDSFEGLTATYTCQGDNTLRNSVWACEVQDGKVVATKKFEW